MYFIGEAFQAKLATWGIHDGGTTSKYATASAICERMHLTVASILRTRYNNAAPNFQVAVEEIKRALAACNHAMRCAVSTALMNNTPAKETVQENLRRQNEQKEFDYRNGGEVLIKNTDGRKLDTKYRGPYPITNVDTNATVEIQCTDAIRERINIRRLVPFRQV